MFWLNCNFLWLPGLEAWLNRISLRFFFFQFAVEAVLCMKALDICVEDLQTSSVACLNDPDDK